MKSKIFTLVSIFLSHHILYAQNKKIELENVGRLTSQEEATSAEQGTGTCIVDRRIYDSPASLRQKIQVLLKNRSPEERLFLKRQFLMNFQVKNINKIRKIFWM